jgi:hypothetical protein
MIGAFGILFSIAKLIRGLFVEASDVKPVEMRKNRIGERIARRPLV